jgi:transcriptional regulator with XRE-family HTH domain
MTGVVMPRQNRPREVRAEGNIAERIRRARSENGWSYAVFAAKMTALGCPIRSSAIQRIETGDPPRSISADEALVIAQILGVSIGRLYQHPDDDMAPLMRERVTYIKQEVDDFRFHRENHLRQQEMLADSLTRACSWLMSMYDTEDEALDVIQVVYDYLDADEKKWFGPSFPNTVRKGR